MNKKIKVLAYMDSPTCATGFGSVSRNILMGLYATGKYEIDVLGINYWGDPHNFPFRIWPVGIGGPDNDPYGRKKVFNMIRQMDFDILFFLQDTFILDMLPDMLGHLKSIGKKFKSVVYYPIDAMPKRAWLHNIAFCDYVVAYAEFAKELSLKAYPAFPKEISIINHGVNTSDFFPIQDKERLAHFRKQYFGANHEKFIFCNVNRNQRRKDIPRTISAFKEFKKTVPDSLLYLHMAKKDQGWDLEEVCNSYGLSIKTDVLFPEGFGPNQGFPREVVNYIYNASDCNISTTHGEGMGLGWLENMATKTPVIMPDNTAMSEFITEDKGYLAKSGGSPSLYTVLNMDNEVIRPIVDVEDMVEKMIHVYNNKEEAMQKAENAYVWATMKMDWQKSIVPKWVNLFDSAYKELIHGDVIVKHKADKAGTIKSEIF
jgi:glycosyltransferase involved in cell wall biosynthesis